MEINCQTDRQSIRACCSKFSLGNDIHSRPLTIPERSWIIFFHLWYMNVKSHPPTNYSRNSNQIRAAVLLQLNDTPGTMRRCFCHNIVPSAQRAPDLSTLRKGFSYVDWSGILMLRTPCYRSTPCAAGARSISFHPAVDLDQPSSLIRSRTSLPEQLDFDLYQHEIGTSQAFQKVAHLMVEKGSLNRQIPVVNFINGDPLFGSLKIQGSNYR